MSRTIAHQVMRVFGASHQAVIRLTTMAVYRLASMRGESGHAPVVLISTHNEADLADLITESAAAGFLPKSQLSAVAVCDLLENA